MRKAAPSAADEAIIKECLAAAVNGPFFEDWEFQTLFGLTRDEVATVLHEWPNGDADLRETAVNNTLNNLLGYPHGDKTAWARFISVTPQVVGEVYARWRSQSLDRRPRGYFDRMP